MPTPRPRRLRAVALGVVLITLISTAGVAAARPDPLQLGTMVDGPAVASPKAVDQSFRGIRATGARHVRVAFQWGAVQPLARLSDVPEEHRDSFRVEGGVPTNWAATDAVVKLAVRRGIDLLPVVVLAPSWARLDERRLWSPPRDPEQFGAFVGRLAARYGTAGSFWTEHPELPRRPITRWQLWNEPAGGNGPGSQSIFWDDPTGSAPWSSHYLAMVKAARRQLAAGDPAAQVVLAGLFGNSFQALDELYRAGGKGTFDVVAVHPYAVRPRDVVSLLRLVRRVMRKHGDAGLPMYVTELSWASLRRHPFDTPIAATEGSQAAKLRRAVDLIVSAPGLRAKRVYWYTWLSRDRSSESAFDYSGLLRLLPGGRIKPKPALRVFDELVERLAHCRRLAGTSCLRR